MLQYYKSVIRSVLDYACPVWQSSLTVRQQDRLHDSIQRRALQIITSSSDYELQCVVLDVEPILMRLDRLARTFFSRICDPSDRLHRLLSPSRSSYIINKLRAPLYIFPCFNCRTTRFLNSFLPYALSNYQLLSNC
jgi:hypothetical protein